MPTPQETRKWFLDLGGQRKGPLNAKDIETLLQEGAVFPSTLLTSNEPGAKPTTVQEVLRQSKPAPTSTSIPRGPRPTPTNIKASEFNDYDTEDPVTDLFNTYQSARDRTSKIPTNMPLPPIPASTRLQTASVFRWKWLGFVAFCSLMLALGVRSILTVKPTNSSSERDEKPTLNRSTPAPMATAKPRPTPVPNLPKPKPLQPFKNLPSIPPVRTPAPIRPDHQLLNRQNFQRPNELNRFEEKDRRDDRKDDRNDSVDQDRRDLDPRDEKRDDKKDDKKDEKKEDKKDERTDPSLSSDPDSRDRDARGDKDSQKDPQPGGQNAPAILRE